MAHNFKLFFVVFIFLIVSLCNAEQLKETGRKGLKHKIKHLYHHPYIFYLAFLAVKIKFAFLVATVITFWIFAGKFYALLRYGLLNKKNDEPEKIYIQPDSHPTYFSAPESDHFDHESYGSSGSSSSYGRDFSDEIFYNSLPKLNFDLTDYAFNSIEIKDFPCRQRFVCEAQFRAKNDKLLEMGMYFLRGGFIKYQTQESVDSLEECKVLFKDCPQLPETIEIF